MVRDAAVDLQRRWGCPAAGRTPPAQLAPDLAYVAEQTARIVGCPPATTCPLACVERADPWVVELTNAVGLVKWLPLEAALGRPLYGADLQALVALDRSQTEALASDLKLAKDEDPGSDPR